MGSEMAAVDPRAQRHRVWPVVAISIGLMLVGFSTAIALQVSNLHSAQTLDDRRITAPGIIVSAGLGSNHKSLRVRWKDQVGRSHLSGFKLYDRDAYWTEGTFFAVKYDPNDVNGKVVAAPNYAEFVEEGAGGSLDELIMLWVFISLPACFILAWLLRALSIWLATSAPATTAYVEPFYYFYKHNISHAMLRLTFTQSPRLAKRTWLQRVMWVPAFDQIPSDRPVTVRIGRGWIHRAVVDLPNGSRIWPTGRLRRRFLLDLGEPRRPDPAPPQIASNPKRPLPSGRTLALLLIFPAVCELKLRSNWPDLVLATAAFYGFMAHIWGWTGGIMGSLWRRVTE